MAQAELHQFIATALAESFTDTSKTFMHQWPVLVATIGPASARTPLVQMPTLAMTTREGGEDVSDNRPTLHQLPVLVAFKTGSPENDEFRSWFFDLDGHTFYALVLGNIGTFVYDLSTDRWSEFVTEGHSVWNAEGGINRRGQIIAADVFNPLLWEVTPDIISDEGFKPIRRTVTAISQARNRTTQQVGAVRIYASAGDRQEPNAAVPATMKLSYSDDQGVTYQEFRTFEITESVTQEYAFRSLGLIRQPGRVWRVEDVGGPVRISDAQIDLLGDENG